MAEDQDTINIDEFMKLTDDERTALLISGVRITENSASEVEDTVERLHEEVEELQERIQVSNKTSGMGAKRDIDSPLKNETDVYDKEDSKTINRDEFKKLSEDKRISLVASRAKIADNLKATGMNKRPALLLPTWVKVLYWLSVAYCAVYVILVMAIAIPPMLILGIPAILILVAAPFLIRAAEDIRVKQVLSDCNQENQRQSDAWQQRFNDAQAAVQALDQLNDLDKSLSKMVDSMSGEAYERYVGYKLRRQDWKSIEYTPATGDYGADIVAVNPKGCKVCIQCKRYSDPVGLAAVQEVHAAQSFYDCEGAMVITTSTFTSAARELAIRTGVELREDYR